MWFWYGILAAVFSAVSVILNKKALFKVSAVLVSWSLFVLPIPFMLLLVLREGIPSINSMFFVGAVGSGIIFSVTKTISLHSLKNSFLTKIFPLTAFGVFFSYFFALIFLSEKISYVALFGMLTILIGSYILNVDRAREGILTPFKLLITHRESFVFMLAMVFTSLTGIFDKVGIVNSNPKSAIFVLFVEDIVMAVLLSIYMFKTQPKWHLELKRNFGVLVFGSLIYTLVAIFFLTAISTGAVALVGAIKKLEIVFVLALSNLIFRDKATRHAWLGAMIMLIGVILIKIG